MDNVGRKRGRKRTYERSWSEDMREMLKAYQLGVRTPETREAYALYRREVRERKREREQLCEGVKASADQRTGTVTRYVTISFSEGEFDLLRGLIDEELGVSESVKALLRLVTRGKEGGEVK
jgi:hypothetical protein